ncbi:MAG: 3-deoxy-D-manno-octulosonic acid kinase [Succinivibrio sp.]|nr:3-deoxy-D-manno-octulosonic acid kinase [Succinivibrio sp.]
MNYTDKKIGLAQYYISSLLPGSTDKQSLDNLLDFAHVEANCGPVVRKGGRAYALLFSYQEVPMVLRHYYRGGFIGKFIGDNFFVWELCCRRSLYEFKLLNELWSEGFPVPRPILARVRYYGAFVRNDIIVEQLLETENLAEILAKRPLTQEEYDRIGLMIRRFFTANVDHTDLNLRNILLDKLGRVYFIDFDKCYRHDLSVERKEAIVDRLERSFVKEQSHHGANCHFDQTNFELLRISALAR